MAKAASGSRTATAPQPERRWQEPQDGWIPLGLATFRFGIADADPSSTSGASTARADLFSIEAFQRSKDREGVSDLGYDPDPPTLKDLTELLREKAGASEAEIDREDGRFAFSFILSGGGPACHGGTPWAILREPDESPELDRRLEAEALFNKEGLVRISDDKAAEGARQSEGVRFATGLVWRRFMLPTFDHAVRAGRVKLFARWPSTSDDFQELPSDIWPLLDVVDWEHGAACDIQGRIYSCIHVADTAGPIDKSGGQSFKAADAVLVEEMRSLILQDTAKNVSDAARQLSRKAMGLGSDDSKVERLRRLYGAKYPTRKKS